MNILKRINGKIRRTIGEAVKPKRICNVCRTEFRGNFQPLHPMYEENLKKSGNPYRFDDAETLNYEEYTCPFCYSSDRDRLYALFLDKALNGQGAYRLLDFAPAPALAKYLKSNPKIDYRSADLFMEGVDDKIDLMDMHAYPDGRFDVFICSHVLEHVTDDKKAMRELYRVLTPGGFGICMVPILLPLKTIDEDITITDVNERWRRFGQDDHVRAYSKQGFIERLEETGFKVDQLTATDLGSEKFRIHGISPKSVLYIVRK